MGELEMMQVWSFEKGMDQALFGVVLVMKLAYYHTSANNQCLGHVLAEGKATPKTTNK